MKLQVEHFRCDDEAQACAAFLLWQQVRYEVILTSDVLRENNGKPGVLIFKDGEIVAKGFMGLVDYFKRTGRLLA